jgi:hypothetical protein
MKALEFSKTEVVKEVNGQASTVAPHWPWLMLFSRITLAFGIQAVFALGFYLAGSDGSWTDSAAWWPFAVTIASLIVLAFLIRLFRSEGKRYWDIFRIDRGHVKGDLLAMLGMLVLIFPTASLPGVLLSGWLFGDPQATLELIIRPLPLLAAYAGIILFPVTVGLTELPTYFGYVMPRLEAKGFRPWLAVALPALILSLQHVALPFLFDVRYLIYRGLMFIPFALLAGIGLHWRPRLMPYYVVVHMLMDMTFATMFLSAAY